MGDVPPIGPIVPPVFAWDPNDLSMFRSVEDAERYMEPIDVNNGVYDATFDAEGRRLRPTVKKLENRFWATGDVRIEATEAVPTGADELREILLKYLRLVGQATSELEKETLSRLVTYYEKTGVALTR